MVVSWVTFGAEVSIRASSNRLFWTWVKGMLPTAMRCIASGWSCAPVTPR